MPEPTGWSDLHDWIPLRGHEPVDAGFLAQMVSDTNYLRERGEWPVTLDASSDDVLLGDLVTPLNTDDDTVIRTTTAGQTGLIGVCLQPAVAGSLVWVRWYGMAHAVNVDNATDAGDFLKSSSTGGLAHPTTDPTEAGVFAMSRSAVATAGQVRAYLLPGSMLASAGGGGGSGGSSWPSGMRTRVAPPNAASWTLTNPGTTSTLTDTTDSAVMLTAIGVGSGNALRLAHKALAFSTPYSVIARLRGMFVNPNNNEAFGLALYSTGDSKITFIALTNSGPQLWLTGKYNSPTSYSANYGTINARPDSEVWFKITNDGSAHRVYSYSLNGVGWYDLTDVGPTDFHTPDHVGWWADGSGVPDTMYIDCLHFEEVNSVV